MILKYFLLGIFTKFVTGFDDTLTHIPVIAHTTKTEKGRLAFALGVFLSICVAVIVAVFFSYLLIKIPYYNYLLGGVFLLIAFFVYFEIFGHKEEHQAPARIKQEVKVKHISHRKFFKLMLIGFGFSFFTVIDDTFAYSSLFLNQEVSKFVPLSGILFASFLEILVIIYFSKQLMKLKFRKQITVAGLVTLGVLVIAGVL